MVPPNYRAVREAAGISRDKAAVQAEVSYPTARLFEIGGPEAIKDPARRARLVETYKALERQRRESAA
jgi:hypothetical protein